MSYVDAFYNRDADIINIVERDSEGKRHYKEYQPRHIFYYPDPKGKFRSMKGEPLTRVSCKSIKDYRKEVAIHSSKKLHESDVNPIYRCLEDHYLNSEAPKLNTAFFDIETDFDEDLGYASPDDPFLPITSIAVHLQWTDTLICLAIPPKTLSIQEARKLVEDIPNTIIFETEWEMLDTFLKLIEDADILSGWNSESFDIPYIVNRTARILSKHDTRRFCLWGELPRKREYEKYGKISTTYDFVGRIHLDSLEMYRKYTYEERHSYRLDAIAEYELGDHKVPYDGTLDQLYNNDFRTFIEYNRQDTALLDKLDKKLKFIDIANTLAHDCTVLLPTTMGAVAVSEQAIINEAHNHGVIVPNRKPKSDINEGAAGAYVAYPVKGLHKSVASIDLNSLYPNCIRSLNMGPETVVGQLRQTATNSYIAEKMANGNSFAASWEGLFGSLEYTDLMSRSVSKQLDIDWENGGSDRLSAAQAYELIFNSGQPWMISANGTIFSYEKEGIISGLLKRWYTERQEMQKKLKDAIAAGNKIEEEYWDKRQLVKKIVLNSLYGALLNPGCRFFDKRLGQSTTLTGRAITQHMTAKTNEIITGKYDYLGETIIYNDTDSVSADSVIRTSNGSMTIEELYEAGTIRWASGEKQYSRNNDIQVLHNSNSDTLSYVNYNYVYRHKVSKKRYKITTANGKSVKVTADHSIMVKTPSGYVEKKPTELAVGDVVVTVVGIV